MQEDLRYLFKHCVVSHRPPSQEKNSSYRSVHFTSAKNDLSHIYAQSLKSFHCRLARRGEMVFLFGRSAVSRYRLVWACEQAVIWPWASHVTQSWVWAEGDRCSAHDSFDATTAAAGMWVVVFGIWFFLKDGEGRIVISSIWKNCFFTLLTDCHRAFYACIFQLRQTYFLKKQTPFSGFLYLGSFLYPGSFDFLYICLSVLQVSAGPLGTWWEPWTGVTR